jgi:predicted nucleotidyltransferase component of viral defense system
MKPPSNLKSLLAKLRNLARREGLPPDAMLLLYIHEGFLARLAVSLYRDNLILKGGLNLYSRYQRRARPTRDIDFAARAMANTASTVEKVIREVASQELSDGLRFDVGSLKTQPILETATYTGVGVSLLAYFEDAFETLQLDLSFGNVITPAPVMLSFPSLLGPETYGILGYPLETIIAEKVAAAVELGIATTRLKDFYDLYYLLSIETLEANTLKRAFERTFKARGTPLEGSLEKWRALENNPNAETAWQGFLRRTRLEASLSFAEVIKSVSGYLEGVLENGEES